jgi:YfiH family protein
VRRDELGFELPGGARALFTTRADGNLSSVGGDGAGGGEEARERLRERIGARVLARGYQVHGRTVRRVREGDPVSPHPRPGGGEADGQATALRGVAATVLAADCLPVVIGGEGAVAAVHAGWRGIAAGVLEEGVSAVRELAVSGRPLVAAIGPGAGPCCYEVGPEVHAALGAAGGRGAVDLAAHARERLLAAGVGDVHVVGACTICEERFFSHRREGAAAGRQAGVGWLS